MKFRCCRDERWSLERGLLWSSQTIRAAHWSTAGVLKKKWKFIMFWRIMMRGGSVLLLNLQFFTMIHKERVLQTLYGIRTLFRFHCQHAEHEVFALRIEVPVAQVIGVDFAFLVLDDKFLVPLRNVVMRVIPSRRRQVSLSAGCAGSLQQRRYRIFCCSLRSCLTG
jgi:hypothetical protein